MANRLAPEFTDAQKNELRELRVRLDEKKPRFLP